jgi:hypothetical protein
MKAFLSLDQQLPWVALVLCMCLVLFADDY